MDAGEAIPSVRALAQFRPDRPGDAVLYETEHSRARIHVLGEGAATSVGPGETWLQLEGDATFEAAGATAAPHTILVPGETTAKGTGLALSYTTHPGTPCPVDAANANPDSVARNQFLPLLDTGSYGAALLGIAAGRRLNAGPESERTFLALRGSGLLFFDDGSTLPFRPHDVAVVPPGWPARIWARGPEDVAMLVLQPTGEPPKERRTLASEIARKREQGDGA